MDQVSRLLEEREGSLPSLLPYAVIAFILHTSVAAAVFIAARESSSPPAQLPAVSVKLLRPTPAPVRKPPQPEPAGPEPQKTALPAPTRAPEPEAIAPAPTAAIPSTVSDDAMPAAHSTPAPPRPPAPAAGGTARGSGLSLGAGGGGDDAAGIPSDFQFTYYVTRMLALIESRWYKPPVPAGTAARVRYRILKNGRIDNIVLEESSGVPSFDRAVLRALYAANPLPPLPPAYLKNSLTVHLNFTE